MQQVWSSDQLNDQWLLSEAEYGLLKGKTDSGRLLCAFLCGQLSLETAGLLDFEPDAFERMARRYAREIRQFLMIRAFDDRGRRAFKNWAVSYLFTQAPDDYRHQSDVERWFCENRFELPGARPLQRLVSSAEKAFEYQLFKSVGHF